MQRKARWNPRRSHRVLGSRSKRERPVTNASSWVTISVFITRDTTFAIYVFEEGYVRVTNSTTNRFIELFYERFAWHDCSPFQPGCHDYLQYYESSSLPAYYNDSAGIFNRLSDTAFSFLSRFFQPHFLTIIGILAFVARRRFLATQRNIHLYAYTLSSFYSLLFFWRRQTGRISSYFIPGIVTQSISCENILCRKIFSALLTHNCQHVIREKLMALTFFRP